MKNANSIINELIKHILQRTGPPWGNYSNQDPDY
jgi:hypothetical protein